MSKVVEIITKILTNILTALYESFGFSILLSFLAMFFYLYAYGQKESHTGRKGPAGENPRTAADGEYRQHG